MIFLVLHQSKRAVHSHLSIRTKPSAGANVFVFVIALRILAWPMIGLSSTCRRLPFISLLGAVRPRSRESSLRKMIFLVLHQSMRQFFSVLSRSSHSLSNSLAWSTFLGTNVFVFVLALGNPRSGKWFSSSSTFRRGLTFSDANVSPPSSLWGILAPANDLPCPPLVEWALWRAFELPRSFRLDTLLIISAKDKWSKNFTFVSTFSFQPLRSLSSLRSSQSTISRRKNERTPFQKWKSRSSSYPFSLDWSLSSSFPRLRGLKGASLLLMLSGHLSQLRFARPLRFRQSLRSGTFRDKVSTTLGNKLSRSFVPFKLRPFILLLTFI